MPETIRQAFMTQHKPNEKNLEKELLAALAQQRKLRDLILGDVAIGFGLGTDMRTDGRKPKAHFFVSAYVKDVNDKSSSRIPGKIVLQTPSFGDVELQIRTESFGDLKLLVATPPLPANL